MKLLKIDKNKLLAFANKHCFTIDQNCHLDAILYEFNHVLPKRIEKFFALKVDSFSPTYLPDYITCQSLREDVVIEKEKFQTLFSQNKRKMVDNYILIEKKEK